MNYLRNAFFAAALLQLGALAADPGLLKLVMPDAKVMADLQVAQAAVSPFGQYILSRMQPDDTGFQNFVTETGFDPRKDLTEIVMASNWQGDNKGRWLVVARGTFNPSQLAAAVLKNGGTVAPFQGISILTPKSGQTVLAFPDGTTGVMGDLADVQSAIQRVQSGAGGLTPPAQASQLSSQYDFWFLTLVPLSEFSSVMPNGNMGKAMKGNLFQAIQQASGGAKFAAQNVQFGAEAVTTSAQNANSLADVVKFIVSMLQGNKQENSTTTSIATLLDTLTVQVNGTTVNMSVTVPEATMEQLFQNAGGQKQARSRHHSQPMQPVQ